MSRRQSQSMRTGWSPFAVAAVAVVALALLASRPAAAQQSGSVTVSVTLEAIGIDINPSGIGFGALSFGAPPKSSADFTPRRSVTVSNIGSVGVNLSVAFIDNGGGVGADCTSDSIDNVTWAPGASAAVNVFVLAPALGGVAANALPNSTVAVGLSGTIAVSGSALLDYTLTMPSAGSTVTFDPCSMPTTVIATAG